MTPLDRRQLLGRAAACCALGLPALGAPAEKPAPDALIGYTEFQTNLPGGRHANVTTMRAVVVKADGTGRRVLAGELTRGKNSWTQFNGWSPDGKVAVFSRAWMSDENGQWEEAHKTFVDAMAKYRQIAAESPEGS